MSICFVHLHHWVNGVSYELASGDLFAWSEQAAHRHRAFNSCRLRVSQECTSYFPWPRAMSYTSVYSR
eukprot:10026703-Heterocapsa_arctica.AAC.1